MDLQCPTCTLLCLGCLKADRFSLQRTSDFSCPCWRFYNNVLNIALLVMDVKWRLSFFTVELEVQPILGTYIIHNTVLSGYLMLCYTSSDTQISTYRNKLPPDTKSSTKHPLKNTWNKLLDLTLLVYADCFLCTTILQILIQFPSPSKEIPYMSMLFFSSLCIGS